MLLQSQMTTLGSKAPDFKLLNTVDGKMVNLADCQGEKGTIVAFICNHCPYVQHIAEEFSQLAQKFMAKGVGFVAISANDASGFPEDGPDKMTEYAEKYSYPFAYAYDETQKVAKAYGAVCTPDFFVYDADLKLYYRGRFDDSSPGNDNPVTGNDLSAALTSLIKGKDAPAEQLPSMGCSIKWLS